MNQQISNNIELIFDELGVDYFDNGYQFRFACPIHGGQKRNACVYKGDDNFPPNWKCYSQCCHESHKGLFGLIKGILNKSSQETIEWLKKLGLKPEAIKNDATIKFSRSVNNINAKIRKSNFKIPLSEISKNSNSFYKSRGISEKVLDEFGVGLCTKKNSVLYGYITVPIFNVDKKSIAGFIGRNPNPKCLICENYHAENKPCVNNAPKWKNTPGFYNNSFFYNIWNAYKHIKATGEVILVEGPADVWKLYELGYKNVLGIFGTSLSRDQKIILEKLPITTVKLFLDPDEAGKKAIKILEEYLERFFNIIIIDCDKQPSECNLDDLENLL